MPHDVPPAEGIPAGGSLPAARSREEFAARLRELRLRAGSPSFRYLAKITNYSSSTLADATSGRRLPTEPVLVALVTACDADPAGWVEELRQLVASAAEPPLPAAASAADVPARPRHHPARWRRAGLALAGLGVLAAGIGAGLALAPTFDADSALAPARNVPSFSGTPTPAPTAWVADGTDPAAAGCKADARLVDRVPVLLDGVQIGALDLLYSPRCGAGWARIYMYPGQPTTMGEVSVRSGDGRSTSIANPLVKQVDDYTDVIVPGPGGCLSVSGAVYEAGKPVVTASLPCEMPAQGPIPQRSPVPARS